MSTLTSLPTPLQQRLCEQLQEGEKVIWASQPDLLQYTRAIHRGGLQVPPTNPLAVLFRRRQARAIVYAVSNRRVITIEGSRHIMVRSYLPQLERVDYDDGCGDLILRKECAPGRNSNSNALMLRHGLFAINNPRRVEALVQKLIRAYRAAMTPERRRLAVADTILRYSE
jgi:hypothetical protein